MRLLQLHYFCALAQREHLYQTASELYISPSALSASISRLESELGVKLFDRVGRNIRLNDNGKLFYSRVSRILNELENACSEIKCSENTSENVLNIATSTHVLWEDAFSGYIRRNPHVLFNHRVVSFDRIASAETADSFDFIITALNDLDVENFEYELIIPNDRPLLAVYEGHPFSDLDSISLIEAANEPFIALSRSFSMRQYFDSLFELADIKPNIVAEGDYSLRAKLIKDRMGITLTTVMGSGSVLLQGLKFINITEPVQPRIHAIFWKKGKKLTPQAAAFKSYLKSYYKNYQP